MLPRSSAVALSLLALLVQADSQPCGFPIAVAPGQQQHPHVVPDGAGGAYVAWLDGAAGTQLRLVRLRADGLPSSGWSTDGLVVGHPAAVQDSFDLALNSDGGALIAFQSGAATVSIQRVDPFGSIQAGWPDDGVEIASYPSTPPSQINSVYEPRVVTDGAEGAYVGWGVFNDAAGPFPTRFHHWTSFVTRIAGSGDRAPGWSDFRPSGGLFDQGSDAALVSDGSGGAILLHWVLTWVPLDGYRLSPEGTITGPRSLKSGGCPVLRGVRLASNHAGGAFAVWDEFCGTPAVCAAQVDAALAIPPGWGPSKLVAAIPGASLASEDVVSDERGGALIAWDSGDVNLPYVLDENAYGDPAPGWPAGGVALTATPGLHRDLVLAGDGAGGVFAAWKDPGNGAPSSLAVQHVRRNGALELGRDGMVVCGNQVVEAAIAPISLQTGLLVWSELSATGDLDVRGAIVGGNHPPECSAVTAILPVVWPPDHRLALVGIVGITDADGDAFTLRITGVTQDEALIGSGTGSTCPDASIDAARGVSVRLERAGGGNGRVYLISFVADDGHGGTCDGSVNVCIPHDASSNVPCVDDGQTVSSLHSCPSGPRLPEDDSEMPGLSVLGGSGTPRLEFVLAREADVDLGVFDVAGRRLATMVHEVRAAGRYEVALPGSIGRGLVFVRLKAGSDFVRRTVVIGE